MNRTKKIIILCSLLFTGLIILGYFLFIKPHFKEESYVRLSKSLRSKMKPMDINNMNIILFTIDTLRADHLECYGYNGVKTPQINRLANEGIIFKQNIVQAPLTLPSHSSILTGTHPLYHGIRDNGGFYLGEEHITLAEVLKNKGFSTAAFVAAFVLDSRWGLNQGFDHYYDNFDLTKYKSLSLDTVQRRGDEVLEAVYDWLEKKHQQKFFAWIHLYDPHTPYDPPEPYKSQYEGKQFGLYDGEIAYVDKLIGEFRKFMEDRKLWEKTLIIFTSDHGESLGEHKENAHGFFIYDSDIKVPLIIRFPGEKFQGSQIVEQVRSIDIMPTILNMIGEESPKKVQGKSLLPFILGKKTENKLLAYSETYWPRFHFGWSELKSLRKDQYKFIDAPKPELYNIKEDPGEIHNLVNAKASLAHEMKRSLDTLVKKYSAEGIEKAGPKKIDNDSLEKLQALGYIGSFHSSAKNKDGELADPKDKIELYNQIKVAQFLVTEERITLAEKKIRQVLQKDPSVLEARYILGNIFFKQNKYDLALEEYKKTLEIDPDYYESIFGMAITYKRMRKYEEAIVGFKRLINIDPKDTKPYLHLGDIYEERGQLDKAMNYLKSAVEINSESPIFHNNLGAVYLKKNMLYQAEREIKKALSSERSVPLLNAHFNMALIHEARKEFDLAIQEYKKEQEISPYNPKPDFNLGLLYAQAGQIDKAIHQYKSCIEKNNEFASAYVFLAKALMDKGENFNRAINLTLKALDLGLNKRNTILAHFVLADIYNRLGKSTKSHKHLNIAQNLQKSLSN